MREKVFRWLLRNHPEAMMLTKPQLFIRATLFPMQWLIRRHSHYDPMRDIWEIHGKKYSGKALFDLANANGATFKVKQVNDCTILERADT